MTWIIRDSDFERAEFEGVAHQLAELQENNTCNTDDMKEIFIFKQMLRMV